MSIRLMSVVWEITFPTQAQKLIALKLADYASDTGNSVYPSNESLAKRAGCDERTVQRTLKAFRECGILRLVRQGGGGPKDTNEWRLNVRLLVTLSTGKATIVGGSKDIEIQGDVAVDDMDDTVSPIESTRVTPEPVRVTPVSAKGDTSVTQSVTNHQLDSSTRASAREGSKSNFESEGSRVAITLTRDHDLSSWQAWVAWLQQRGRSDLAELAEAAGKITAPSRFPKADSPLPKIPQPKKSITNRITGDAA